MSTEENKALVYRYCEAWNKHNVAAMEELYAPDLVSHSAGVFPDMDREGVKQMYTAVFFPAFPDAHIAVEDLIAEGDKVVCRWTVRGTHRGEFMGVPPTGKQVSFTGIEIERIEDDRFVEFWTIGDMLGVMQQLGAIPQMAQAGA
jgi:steroid delta-isomerase-like uncharacterized protein